MFVLSGTRCDAPQPYMPFEYNGDLDASTSREQLIQEYFFLGFSYIEILEFLLIYHNISISMRHLHRLLREMGLRRRLPNTKWNEIIYAIEKELAGPGRNLGYRGMQARLRLYHGLVVDRETVRQILKFVDPEGVSARRRRRLKRRKYSSKGPNYLYHIDGWDKLKRYGLCVHVCIDGFSRTIMWLEAEYSNNDPYIVCQYFVQCIQNIHGLPFIVRADRGTENCNIEFVQTVLRNMNADQRGQLQTSFMYGRSTSNQRMEAWWSKFPGLGTKTWIHHFKLLEQHGIIDTSRKLDLQCVRFCYLELMRHELDTIKSLWNTHHIRPSRNEHFPSGKPDVMYYMPHLYGTTSFMQDIDREMADVLAQLLTREPNSCIPIQGIVF